MSYESLRLLFRGGIRPVGGSFAQLFENLSGSACATNIKLHKSRGAPDIFRLNCVRKLDVTLDVKTKKRLKFVCVRARQPVLF